MGTQLIHENERAVCAVSENPASHLIKAQIRVFVRFSAGKQEILFCGNNGIFWGKQMDREARIQISAHFYRVKSAYRAGEFAYYLSNHR